MEILRSSNFKVYTISVPRVCVNFADVDGYTALHYACLRQNHKIADQLLQAGADTTAQWVVTYAIALFVVDTIYVRWHSEWSPCEKYARMVSLSSPTPEYLSCFNTSSKYFHYSNRAVEH